MQSFTRWAVRLGLLFGFGFLLGGCAPFGTAPMVKSVVPPEQPLVPAAIYVPDCNYGTKEGALAFMGASDRSAAESICAVMWQAALLKFSSDPQHFVVLHLITDSLDEKPGNLQPDLAAEQRLGAKYRVLLRRPVSFRQTETLGGGFGVPSSGSRSWVEVSGGFSIVDIAQSKTLGGASSRLSGAPLEAAGYLMDRLAGGLLGPRCAAYYFNSFSVKSALQEIPVCQTFSLPAPQPRTDD